MPAVEIVVSTLNSGGIANVVRAFAAALQKLELFSTVVTLQNAVPDDLADVKVTSLGVAGNSSNIAKFYIALKRIIRYKILVNPVDANVHFCMDPSSLLVTLVSNISKKHKFVAWCATPKELLVLSDKLIIKYVYHKICLVVVPTEKMKIDLLEINSKMNISVIPNPLSLIEISCVWPQLEINNANAVLYLGRFSSEKGVEIIPKLAIQNPDISFSMVGDGPLLGMLQRQKHDMCIHNLKIAPWGDSRKYLQETSLLLLPSLYESFGLVIIESWAYGKPVIASDLASGPKDLIMKHGGGSLVKNYDDLDEWTDTIRRMMNTNLEAEFITNIIEIYSVENIVKKWLVLAGIPMCYL
jgi:glycosyltransferase involved in cell wall biosynthesis